MPPVLILSAMYCNNLLSCDSLSQWLLLHYPLHTVNATPDLLTINDLLAVQNATWSTRSKGYNIGLGLGIQPGTLDAIWNNDRRCD